MSRRKRKESHWHDGQPSGYDWISRTTRLAIYARDNWECLACGNTSDLTLDHLRRDVERPHHHTNLVTLCLTCNSSRRNSPADVWDPKFAEIAAFQVTKPLDRKAALALAKQKWPGRYARAAARQAANREKKKTSGEERGGMRRAA